MKRLLTFVLLICILLLPAMAIAQGCSVCTKTASELGSKGARGLNGGILYLAFLPLIILGTVGYMWWKRERHVS